LSLTNNTTRLALTLVGLHKCHWQVKLNAKRIKHHLRHKKLLGTSENSVKTQTLYTVATYVLIVIVKKGVHLNASLHTCLSILSASTSEKSGIAYPWHGNDWAASNLKCNTQQRKVCT
jgi:hypothetical protein